MLLVYPRNLNHAWLFSGGGGKKSSARYFALCVKICVQQQSLKRKRDGLLNPLP